MKSNNKKEKPLYISVEYHNYKQSKSEMLNSQINLLTSMKHLQNLKQIKDEKFKTKLQLYSLLSGLAHKINELESKLPEVDMPEETPIKQPKENNKITVKSQQPEPEIEDNTGIEFELRQVQEKLRRLNI